MTNQEYHADTSRISKSGLDLIARSPLHYWAKYLDPNRQPETSTPTLIFGSAWHSAIFEPNDFERHYIAGPDLDRRTSDGKAAWQNFLDSVGARTVLKRDEYETCLRMRDSAFKHSGVAFLLKAGIAERTVCFTEPETQAPCKCRPDFLSETGWVVDGKTTEDASPSGFGRSALGYRYDVQAAFYMDGLEHGGYRRPQGFAFIAQEKKPPYAVAIYYTEQDVLDLGKMKYMNDLRTYMRCRATGVWPGYEIQAQPLQLPKYAFYQTEE